MKSIKNFENVKIQTSVLYTLKGGVWKKSECGSVKVSDGYVMDYQCDIYNTETGDHRYYGTNTHPA